MNRKRESEKSKDYTRGRGTGWGMVRMYFVVGQTEEMGTIKRSIVNGDGLYTT